MSDDTPCDCPDCQQRAEHPDIRRDVNHGALEAIFLEAFLAIETREWQRRRLRTLRGVRYTPEPVVFVYRDSTSWVWAACLSATVPADEPGLLNELLRFVVAHEAACGGHALMRLPPAYSVGLCMKCAAVFQ